MKNQNVQPKQKATTVATKTQLTAFKLSQLSVEELDKVSGGITSYGGVQM